MPEAAVYEYGDPRAGEYEVGGAAEGPSWATGDPVAEPEPVDSFSDREFGASIPLLVPSHDLPGSRRRSPGGWSIWHMRSPCSEVVRGHRSPYSCSHRSGQRYEPERRSARTDSWTTDPHHGVADGRRRAE
jgi:hypothetical protein